MRRRFRRLAFVVVLAAACGRTGVQPADVGPTPPTSVPSVTPSGTAIPTATPPLSSGDGQDGPLALSSGTQTINVCWPVQGSGSSITLVSGPAAPRLGRRLLVLQVQDDFATAGAT